VWPLGEAPSGGQPGAKMPDGKKAAREPPFGGDRDEGIQHETAFGEQGMGDDEPGAARSPARFGPEQHIEVQHARTPSFATPAPERAFHLLEVSEQGWRGECRLDRGGGIGEGAAAIADGARREDRRQGEQGHILAEQGGCGADNRFGTAVAAVAAIGAKSDRVAVHGGRVAGGGGAVMSNLSRRRHIGRVLVKRPPVQVGSPALAPRG
jgi:hypothetical protein